MTSSGEPSCPASCEGLDGDLVPPLLTRLARFLEFLLICSDACEIRGLWSGDLELDVAIGIPPVVDWSTGLDMELSLRMPGLSMVPPCEFWCIS